ncbi:MAG: hypothetical protein CMM55_16425 [Rhodospirillaceae bacterium]|nr:hypothetical protein [Rhodospirillaceae bacterium]
MSVLAIRNVIRLFGKRRNQLARSDNSDELVVQLIKLHDAGALIDVGANVGQYAQRMRASGLDLPIVSFEPGMEAYSELLRAAADDPTWTVAPRMAISDVQGTATLNVNKRSDMNSLKPITEKTLSAFPKAKPLTIEEVATERLDHILDEFIELRDRSLFLKIDTQGSELEVIRGAERLLHRIVAIQLEMSLLPLYEGEKVYLVLLNELDRLGFDLHLVLPGYFSRALGQQLQFDGLFVRRSG